MKESVKYGSFGSEGVVLVTPEEKEGGQISKAHKHSIDPVVLDMIMRNIGGGEAYDGMKEINPDVKILLWSGYSIDGQATEILARGCDAFIQKPFSMEALSQGIKEVLEKE